MNNKIPFHALAEIFPLMSDAEFANLCADIRVNGLREDIWTYQGAIIDGRNRYRACLREEIEPRFREWTGTGSLTGFVVSLNLHRRHLSESQRAMVAARIANLRDGDNSQAAEQSEKISQADAARLLNVSPRSVWSANQIQEHGVLDLIEMVEAGEVSVSSAAKLASMPKTKQKRLIKKGKNKLVSIAQNLRVEGTLKKARTTSGVCFLCNPELEVTEENFLAFLYTAKQKLDARRNGAKFSRYISAAIEEIEELGTAGEIEEVYDAILAAIDAGFQTEADICKRTGYDKETVRETLKLMDGASIEPVPQGGKTEMARGGRKILWQRKQQVFGNCDDEVDEFGADEIKVTLHRVPDFNKPINKNVVR